VLQKICAVVFWPLAAIMGVEIEDAGKIASLIGTKVFVDEFISFKDLGDMVRKGEVKVRQFC
jgi:pyrimidine nucleoside transport protein